MEIQSEVRERVLHLKMNRPEKRNALNLAMYRALTQALEQAAEDPVIRALVLTGDAKAFCSGNDIGDFLSAGDAGLKDTVIPFLHALAAFPKPIVAAVRGNAVGVGTTMLLHCDLAYADESARFKLPFVDLGLVPEGGSSLLLPAMLGHVRAAELLLLAETFDAHRATALGIINACCDGDVEAHAFDQARRLAAKPPAAMAQAKALMKQNRGRAVAEVLDIEGLAFRDRLHAPEAVEALTAFQERRAPDFSQFE